MKKTRRLSKLLKSDCGQCSSCCRNLQVDITDVDIERLLKHTGITADRLVKLYSREETEDKEDSDWIGLSYGKRAMQLNKRRNGDCIFLADDKSCKAYEARPMTCRIFPVCVVYDDKDKIVDLEVSEVITDKTIKCKRTRGNGHSYELFMSTARQSQKEHESFLRKLDEWNDLPFKGVKKDFLNYLGFKSSNNGSKNRKGVR